MRLRSRLPAGRTGKNIEPPLTANFQTCRNEALHRIIAETSGIAREAVAACPRGRTPNPLQGVDRAPGSATGPGPPARRYWLGVSIRRSIFSECAISHSHEN